METTHPSRRSLFFRWWQAAILAVTVSRTAAFGLISPELRHSGLPPSSLSLMSKNAMDADYYDVDTGTNYPLDVNRRGLLVAVSAAALQLAPQTAQAADGGGEGVSPKEMLARMRPIPTFTIVDGNTGVPYMIVDKQGGGATGYFFTSFQGALFVLEEAKRDAEKNGYTEVWENAKIVTVPLDIAMRLALKKVNRTGQNDMKLDTIGDIIASAEAIEAALKYDTSGRYKQQGSVPLFYIDGLEMTPGNDGEKRTPVYFTKSDLIAEWNKQNAGSPSPDVKVVDLIDTFRATMKPGVGSNNELLKRLVFVPTADTVKVARNLKSKESVPQYKMNEMLAVGGK